MGRSYHKFQVPPREELENFILRKIKENNNSFEKGEFLDEYEITYGFPKRGKSSLPIKKNIHKIFQSLVDENILEFLHGKYSII